jgi:nicotinate-nucleotide adenylyltransferase
MGWIRPPGPVADGLTIALLGGSFDPAHDGHRYASLVALRALNLDYVWWLVSPGNPLKPAPRALAARLAQARRLAAHPRIRVTAVESELGTRYTIDTIRALARRFPRVRFVWLMGSDNLLQFSRWRCWQQIAMRIAIVVVRRPGSALATLPAVLTRRFGQARVLAPPPLVLVLDGRRNPASSTRLRRARARGLAGGLGDPAEAMLNPLL